MKFWDRDFNFKSILKKYKPIVKEMAYTLPRTGGFLLTCSKCKNDFVEPFDESFLEYKYCPVCGVRIK